MRQLRRQNLLCPVPVAAFIAHEVAACLGYAHDLVGPDGKRMNIVHRDISPSNIMCLRTGGVKLLDFGIAKAAGDNTENTEQGLFKGKLAYVAPERIKNEALDGRVDIFGLGVVLWEMLVGKRLFRGKSELETLNNVLEMPVPPPSTERPDIPASLDAVVMKALARNRERPLPDGTGDGRGPGGGPAPDRLPRADAVRPAARVVRVGRVEEPGDAVQRARPRCWPSLAEDSAVGHRRNRSRPPGRASPTVELAARGRRGRRGGGDRDAGAACCSRAAAAAARRRTTEHEAVPAAIAAPAPAPVARRAPRCNRRRRSRPRRKPPRRHAAAEAAGEESSVDVEEIAPPPPIVAEAARRKIASRAACRSIRSRKRSGAGSRDDERRRSAAVVVAAAAVAARRRGRVARGRAEARARTSRRARRASRRARSTRRWPSIRRVTTRSRCPASWSTSRSASGGWAI